MHKLRAPLLPLCVAYFQYFINENTYKLMHTRESNDSAKININQHAKINNLM